VAFLQRLALHHGIGEAATVVRASEGQQDEFYQLHADSLDFTVTGHFTGVSSGQALNRFYRMAQQGLGMDHALLEKLRMFMRKQEKVIHKE
jgi:hypothetical protein